MGIFTSLSCACRGNQTGVSVKPHHLQTIREVYDKGASVYSIHQVTGLSATSAESIQTIHELCTYGGLNLRPEYAVHFARRGTMSIIDYQSLGFSGRGEGDVPLLLNGLSLEDRADVLRDYGRALQRDAHCSLHEVSVAIEKHRLTTPLVQCVPIILQSIRDAMEASRDPETLLLKGVLAALRVGNIEHASLFLAHVECKDVVDDRRRRLLVHILQSYFAMSVLHGEMVIVQSDNASRGL